MKRRARQRTHRLEPRRRANLPWGDFARVPAFMTGFRGGQFDLRTEEFPISHREKADLVRAAYAGRLVGRYKRRWIRFSADLSGVRQVPSATARGLVRLPSYWTSYCFVTLPSGKIGRLRSVRRS